MKGMKKIAVIFLAGMMTCAAAAMSACGEHNGRTKIYLGMWPEESLTQDIKMYKTWKEKFEADYPEYEIVPAPYTYSPDTVTAKATSKQLPTIFQTYFTEPQKLINNGFIREVTSELKELGWYDKMDADMRAALTSGGEVYGVPRDGYGMGLFLNLEMLEDVGVIGRNADGSYRLHDETGAPLYPTTFDELRETSELIVSNYANAYGMVILSANKNGGWQFSNMAWNFGCEALQIENPDGTWTANLNDPAAIKALEWIQDMKRDEFILPGASYSYQDWYAKIGSKTVAMAFCGSDALALPATNYNFPLENMAFVPMPTGDGVSRYSLYGGTPFVFASYATDEQVKGALLFLKYMGRSPETDEISRAAILDGYKTAAEKEMPVLPTIKAWSDPDYLAMAEKLEQEHINVNMNYYSDFFDTIQTMKKSEEPNYCQDMYGLLDNAIQSVLSNQTAVAASELTTANNQFQANYLSKIKGDK